MMRLKQNVDLDAGMVIAAMTGNFAPFCIGIGLDANESFRRAKWLKNQPEDYIQKVVEKATEIRDSTNTEARRE